MITENPNHLLLDLEIEVVDMDNSEARMVGGTSVEAQAGPLGPFMVTVTVNPGSCPHTDTMTTWSCGGTITLPTEM